MNNNVPDNPKIYHIVPIDRLESILRDQYLFSDANMQNRPNTGTTIGMNRIKKRRLDRCEISCYPGLFVGHCVPFYLCNRSVMLYMLHMNNNEEIKYHGGQEQIIHLEADLHRATNWASNNQKRWAFTTRNASDHIAEFKNKIADLTTINWNVINAQYWKENREEKQAEFLVENEFPWHLFDRIGVYSTRIKQQVDNILANQAQKPQTEVKRNWYY